jgi:ATP-dependent DNA helicase RecG
MLALSASPCGRARLATKIGHKSITGALRQALADLLAAGLVELTIPDTPPARVRQTSRSLT